MLCVGMHICFLFGCGVWQLYYGSNDGEERLNQIKSMLHTSILSHSSTDPRNIHRQEPRRSQQQQQQQRSRCLYLSSLLITFLLNISGFSGYVQPVKNAFQG